MRNMSRKLFAGPSSDFKPLITPRNYESQEKSGAAYEFLMSGFSLMTASKKASLLMGPGYVSACISTTLRHINNLTIAWTIEAVCQDLSHAIEIGKSCIKSTKKSFPLWSDEIVRKESQFPKNKKKKQKPVDLQDNDNDDEANVIDTSDTSDTIQEQLTDLVSVLCVCVC